MDLVIMMIPALVMEYKPTPYDGTYPFMEDMLTMFPPPWSFIILATYFPLGPIHPGR